jgi:hypothetical protein
MGWGTKKMDVLREYFCSPWYQNTDAYVVEVIWGLW